MKESKDPNKGQVHSPAGRDEVIANCDGMPEKMTPEMTWKENTPPKKYADDSTTGLGKPNV